MPPQVSWNDVTRVWQVLWNTANGNPNEKMTRQEVQSAAGPTVPDSCLRGCLRVYADYSLIRCVKNDAIIDQPEKDADFDQFRLTGKGSLVGNALNKSDL